MGLAKLRVGDPVVVTTGRYKGHQGRLDAILSDGRLHVSGCTRIKHVRANPQREQEGGRLSVPMPIHRSNVSYYDAQLQRGVKVGVSMAETGKVRLNKKTGEPIETTR